MTTPLVIHHQGCSDGMCSALIFSIAMDGNVELLPAQYGDEPPWDQVDDREVWIVDFSYSREQLIEMNKRAAQLVVYDHHATAQQNCEGLDFCVFDMDRCGAMLALEDLTENYGAFQDSYDEEELGEYLHDFASYVQDRDLWQWKLPYSREINAWLSSYARDVHAWYTLLEDFAAWGSSQEGEIIDPVGVAGEGAAILRMQGQQLQALTGQAWDATHSGPYLPPTRSQVTYQVKVTNSPVLQSEVAGELAEDADFGVAWWQGADGEYIYSLRSRGDVDVSEVAKHFGGGGHPQAAGFKTAKKPEEIFKR